MAHYARLGVNNVVIRVDKVDNSHITTSGGIEKDAEAFDHLFSEFGAGTWVKCSYNTQQGVHGLGGTPLRANFPGGAYDEVDPWYYDSTNDIFRKARPKDKDDQSCASWTLNTTTGNWVPPIAMPEYSRSEIEAGKMYVWDESAYQSDNSTGWILI